MSAGTAVTVEIAIEGSGDGRGLLTLVPEVRGVTKPTRTHPAVTIERGNVKTVTPAEETTETGTVTENETENETVTVTVTATAIATGIAGVGTMTLNGLAVTGTVTETEIFSMTDLGAGIATDGTAGGA